MTERERVEDIRKRHAAATPGPWRWRGHRNQSIELRGGRFGDVVLAPERSGFHWPAFKVNVGGLLHSIREFAVKEVPYREDVIGIDHPDCAFIESSKEDVGFLLEMLDRVAQERDALELELDRSRTLGSTRLPA